MLIKTSKGYVIKSHSGKKLGGPYKTKREGTQRLKQIEYFKHHKNKRKGK